MTRLEIMRMDRYLGFYNPKTHKRYSDLYPNKNVIIKRKATMFEGGYRELEVGDIHKQLMNRRTVSLKEYIKLSKKFKGMMRR